MMNFYTPWTNTVTPPMPGLYLTKVKNRVRRQLVKLTYWDGSKWMLTGEHNQGVHNTLPISQGRLVQRRYWCGLAFNPEEIGMLPSMLLTEAQLEAHKREFPELYAAPVTEATTAPVTEAPAPMAA